MAYRQITFASIERAVCKNVRKTKSGRFLIHADPAGNITLRVNVKPMLSLQDSIGNVAANADTVTWTGAFSTGILDFTISNIPYMSGDSRDYGHYSGHEDPNFWVSITLLSGQIIVIGIVARNYNKPHETPPETISTAKTTASWATLSPLYGDDVGFAPSDPSDAVRQILMRPMDYQSMTDSVNSHDPDSINLNTEAFTYEEEDIDDASSAAETPSSGTFVSTAGANISVTGS